MFAEVQRPQVCLLSCDMYIEKVYFGVPVSREVVLHNQSMLRAQFEWKEVRAEIKAYSAISVAGLNHIKVTNLFAGKEHFISLARFCLVLACSGRKH